MASRTSREAGLGSRGGVACGVVCVWGRGGGGVEAGALSHEGGETWEGEPRVA